MSNRIGPAQTRTADQLKEQLTVPLFYILIGQAQAAFPYTGAAAPSHFVQIIRTGPGVSREQQAGFPVSVNWKQWRLVLAPILEDEKWSIYLGDLGPGPITTCVGVGLFQGRVGELIDLLGQEILTRAIEQGYGSPDQSG